MTNCDICGNVMIELSPWDFKTDVCLNHDPPHFIHQSWLHSAKREDRPLETREIAIIEMRGIALQKRLQVVKTPKETWSVVLGFLFGGWNPEIDERVTLKKGVHL